MPLSIRSWVMVLQWLLLSGYPLYAQTGMEWHDMALKAIMDKQYKQAVQFASNAIALEPVNADVWHRRGYAYYLLSMPDSCITDCSKAISLNGGIGKFYIIRARAYTIKKQYKQVVPDYEKTLSLQPELMLPSDFEWFGYSCVQEKKYVAAVTAYNTALEKKPNDPYSFVNRGIALEALSRNEEALKDYSACIQFAPEKIMGYQYRGLLLRKMSRHKESIDDWEKIVSLEPKNAYAASMVAHAWYSYGRTRADARETNMITEGRIAAALKLNPQDATLYNIRGMNRYFGKYSDNLDIEYLNEAIKIDPNVPNFYNNRGYVFANKSKWAEAVADYDKAIAVGGKNYQPFYKDYREYAVSKLASQPGASAAQMYDEAMRLYDNIQKDEAIALMNKAIALEPKNARMYFGRYKVSKYTDKSSWITKAVNLEPTNAEYMYWYGHELYLHNQDDAAIAAFDKAMKLGGTHLPEANKNVFGYNYKQNILNKRSVAANQSAIAQKNNNGSNVQVTPELIKMMQEVLATTKKTIQAKQPGVKFLKSGRFGSEGFSTKAYVQYGESLSLLLIYPSNTKVTSFSNCEPNNLGPYIMTMCTETNMSLEQAGKIFTVMVQGPGPVFYELAHLGPK